MGTFRSQGIALLSLSALSLVSCQDPMETLYKFIRKLGYNIYYTPLEFAGTGTLIAGTPKKILLVAHPQTCFPDEINGLPTNLRHLDQTTLPDRAYSMTFDAKVGLELVKAFPIDNPQIPTQTPQLPDVLQGLQKLPWPQILAKLPNWPLPITPPAGMSAMPTGARSKTAVQPTVDPVTGGTYDMTIKAGFEFHKVKNFNIHLEGVAVEYIDLLALKHYYREQMDQDCKDYLNEVGFILQAIKAEKMRFSFMSESGGLIDLSLVNIDNILRIDPRIQWKIVKKVYLEFDSPRYIGYQLGRLKTEDQGVLLYRSTQEKKDKFVFEKIGIFQEK